MNASVASQAGIQPNVLAATMDGRRISVGVSSDKVVWARHEGTADDREAAILQRVCDEMVGHSLREAAEHSAIYAADALARSGSIRRPAGISLPRAMGRELERAEALARLIYRDSIFQEKNRAEWNFEDRGLSYEWTARDNHDKLVKILDLLAEFFGSQHIAADTFSIAEIDRHERIDVKFSNNVAISEKPKLLMDFEKFLRNRTGERLEVFVTEMKDLNRIRRL